MDSFVDIVDNVAHLTCAWRDCDTTFTRDARQVMNQWRGGKRKFFCSPRCAQYEARSRMGFKELDYKRERVI